MVGPIITLTTDFGWGSGYVAQLKAAVWELCPAARLVDISHSVSPQNIHEANFLMRQVAFAFGVGTVHVVVVDPGVGTSRRGLACRARGTTFVGPDNGVLSVALEDQTCEAVEIDAPHLYRQPLSNTFHGRDIFAPIGAELAAGLPITEVGPELKDPVLLPLPKPVEGADGSIEGVVVYCDSFGNLITNIDQSCRPGWSKAVIGMQACERVETYGSCPAGTLCALVGSGGKIEIAVADGSAASRFGGEAMGLTVRVSD